MVARTQISNPVVAQIREVVTKADGGQLEYNKMAVFPDGATPAALPVFKEGTTLGAVIDRKVSLWVPDPTDSFYEQVQSNEPWRDSTDGMNAEDGQRIEVQPNHTINLPDATTRLGIEFAPSNANWPTLVGFTIQEFAGWTIANEPDLVTAGADILTMIPDPVAKVWTLAVGGGDVPIGNVRVATKDDLDAQLPTTRPGTMGVVIADGIAANNGPYYSTGTVGASLSTGWVQV